MAEYEQIMQRANQVGSQPYQQYGGQMVAPFSAEQQSGIGAINNAQGIAQPYFDTAKGYGAAGAAPITAEEIARYQNPYQQQVVNATLGNINLLNQQQQAGLESGLAGSGGLFNDRMGVAQAQLAGQQATSEAPTIAGLEASGYTQALGAAQADRAAQGQAAYTFGNLGTANLQDILSGAQAQFGAGTAEQQLAQQYLNVPYQQFQAQQAFPYQQLSWLAGIGTGVGSNEGGTSTSTTTPAKPWYQFWNRGGGIKRPGYDDGGGIGGMAPYPYAGASSYIPGGISISHGSGPPKPGGGATQKAQDPFGDITKIGNLTGLDKKAGSLFSPSTQGGIPDLMGMTDPSVAEAQQAGLASGLSADEVGLGAAGEDAAAAGAGDAAAGGLSDLFALFALNRGGGINLRRGYDDGGGVGDDDSPGYTDYGNDAPLVPSRVSPEAGLGELASIPPSTTGFSKPSWAGPLDPSGLAATPSRAPVWPGEKPPPEPTGLAPRDVSAVAASPVAVSNRTDSLRHGAGEVDIERAKRAIGTFESGNNYQSVGPQTHLGRALGRYQVMEQELPGQLKQAGLPPMTPQEFLRDRDAQDKLFETVFGGLQKKYGNFNDAASVWFSGRPADKAGNARDVLGTTVPQYLANTNAILARDDGDNPRYGPGGAGGDHLPANASLASGRGGLGDVGARVRSTSDGEGEGETRTQRGSGLGRLFTADNALRFGLAMLANPTPYLGTAIGQAGIATLGASQESERYGAKQEQEARKEGREERKLKLDEGFKNARVEMLNKGMELQGKKLDEQNARHAETMTRLQDAATRQQAAEDRRVAHEQRLADKPPEGFEWTTDPTSGQKTLRPTSGGPRDPAYIAKTAGTKAEAVTAAKAGPASDAASELSKRMFPEETIDGMARQYMTGDRSVMQNLGRGAQGVETIARLRNKVREIAQEQGLSPQDIATRMAEFGGRQAAERTVGTRMGNITVAMQEANQIAPLALELNDKISAYRTQFPNMNAMRNAIDRGTGGEDIVKFDIAAQSLAMAYAKALAPTGASDEETRRKARAFLDTAYSNGQFKAAVAQIQREIELSSRTGPAAIKELRKMYGEVPGSPEPEPGGGGGGAAAGPREGDRKQFKQGVGIFRNGQWVPETAAVP
jgi:hypothetical protein